MATPFWTSAVAVGSGGALLVGCCVWTLRRWCQACAAEQRRALRDGDLELGSSWRPAGGRRGARHYARVPVTDPNVFVGLPA